MVAFRIFVICVVFLTLGGCNASEQQNKNEVVDTATPDNEVLESALRKRVLGRWDALLEQDFDGAYQYMSPAYRKLYTPESFASRFGSVVAWESVEFASVQISENRAKAVLEIHYHLMIPGADGIRLGEDVGLISKQIDEDWIWLDNKWWFVEPAKSNLGTGV